MRLPSLRAALSWSAALGLSISAACLVLAIRAGVTAHDAAWRSAASDMAAQSDILARAIEADLALFDVVLRQAAGERSRDNPAANGALPELPLTAAYVGFINILNESGDVIADPKPTVSRPANFAGRDYFQDHLKNPAGTLMIGRPFATAPNQHPSIPLSRRLDSANGGFAGVAVAGVRLAWLADIVSRKLPGPPATITVRRDDGLILMRFPPDPAAIGRGDTDDPEWQAWRGSGVSQDVSGAGGIRLFRRLNGPPLVLQLTLPAAAIVSGQPAWLPVLVLAPMAGLLAISLLLRLVLRRAAAVEDAAHAANSERMRLLASMSHELRTPLTGILGQASLLMDEGGLNPRQATRVTRLTEAASLMRGIVNRVIDFARPDERGAAPVPVACDLDALIRTCIGIVEDAARRKGLTLTDGIDLDAPRRAMLARDHVQQALINLLMNAVNFTEHGGVTLRVSGDARRLRFAVADTGPGIPSSKLRRLFRAYDRLDTSSRAIGSGLGLTITERLVRDMGGQIGHAPNPGGGSVFWIELPAQAPPEEAASGAPGRDPRKDAAPETAAQGPPEPAGPPRPAIRPAIPPWRLLLADDLELTRAVTADYLRGAGYSVTEVADGEAAVAAVRDGDFEAVLTDMRMPVVDGLEVTRRIRALPGPRGRTPIILVTADMLALGEGGQHGVDACVAKPFTRTELLAAVAGAARPPPERDRVLNRSGLTELLETLGPVAFAAHLEAAIRRIEALIAQLDRPGAAADPEVHGAVHDMVGVAGLLGLGDLSDGLRRFDIARDRQVAPLRAAAAAALLALRRHPVAAMPSAC